LGPEGGGLSHGVRRLAPRVPFGKGLTLGAKMMTAIPPEEVGRMMSGVEAAELIGSSGVAENPWP
jgi:hypothetical protein